MVINKLKLDATFLTETNIKQNKVQSISKQFINKLSFHALAYGHQTLGEKEQIFKVKSGWVVVHTDNLETIVSAANKFKITRIKGATLIRVSSKSEINSSQYINNMTNKLKKRLVKIEEYKNAKTFFFLDMDEKWKPKFDIPKDFSVENITNKKKVNKTNTTTPTTNIHNPTSSHITKVNDEIDSTIAVIKLN
ncbi:hypothetical protein ACTFIU_010562 [Dictyostelium citrinum]